MDILKVFVGHSHDDDGFCSQLASALRGAGADVWCDEQNIGVDDQLDTTERELRTRPAFILILSQASVASQRVRDEVKLAFAQQRREPERVLLPVLAKPLGDDAVFWLWLRDFKNAAPFPSEEAIRLTLRALALTPAGEAQVEQMPQLGEGGPDLLIRGKALMAQGDCVAALRFFEVATQLVPTSWDAWHNRGSALAELQRLDEARLATERALALDAGNAATWANRGWQLNDLKRFAEALTSHERAIALDRQCVKAWVGIGGALYGLARHADAAVAYEQAAESLAAFEQALALDPLNARSWAGKGAALYTLKRYAEALAASERATELAPHYAYAWSGKGTVLEAVGRTAEAQGALARATELAPHYAYAWSGKAIAKSYLDQARESKEAETRVSTRGR